MLTMSKLMNDPIYRAYMKRNLPTDGAPTPAWILWVKTPDNRWLTKTYTSYADAWPMFVRQFRAGSDPTITAKRTFYAPPGEFRKVRVKLATPRKHPTTGAVSTHRLDSQWRQTFHWDDWNLEWCGRCRRPVQFVPLFETHHALSRWPVVSDEDNIRCPICGIRRSAQPPISHMVKL